MGHQASCYDDGRSVLVEGGGAPEKRAAREPDRATSSRLVFARSRVFKPHTRTRLQDFYQQEKLLGQGSHGKVIKAAAASARGTTAEGWLNSRGVAVKCFALGGGPGTLRTQQGVEGRAAKASFERERQMLAQLEHPHIVKMFECFEDRDHLFIVMEVCHGGELYEYVADRVTRGHSAVGLEQGLVFFRQMLHATSYLHAKQLVHRDLKTENFLLLGPPGSPDADVVKMCDFGSTTLLHRLEPRAMGMIGTLSYTAPEVYLDKGANFAADDWSLGACLYVLLVGGSPFRVTGEETQQQTVERIIRGDFERGRPQWTKLPREVQDLVGCLLERDERVRLTCAQALEHPWVARGRDRRAPGRAARPPPARGAGAPPQRNRAILQEFAEYGACLFQHLAQFASLDMMQRIVLNVCAQLTPETEVIHCCMPLPWYNLFFALDVDLDGRLSREELLGGLGQLPGHGHSEEELEHFFYAVDVDGSGSVEWVEWVALSLLSNEGLLSDLEPLRTAFRLLDRPSGDGRVGAADLLALIEVEGSDTDVPQDGLSQANLLLGKWAARGGGRPPARRHEACLGWADLRLLLEEAAVDSGGVELTEDGSEWRGSKAGFLCCTSGGGCAVEGCKELASQPLLFLRESTFGSEVSDAASPRSSSSPYR